VILLISYGNGLRRDDGAGHVLAATLERRWRAEHVPCRHVAVRQLLPELAADIARPGVTALVFVDASDASRGEGPDRVLVRAVTLPAATAPSLGHQLGPATLMAYAGLLSPESRGVPAWLVTVPGVDFGHGQGLSVPARRSMDTALAERDGGLHRLLAAGHETRARGN
jgi:hydrogenase maturation protease